MPGRKHRGPEFPRTISINGGLHKTPRALTKTEIALLERFLDWARIGKTVRKRHRSWRPVPAKVWEPLAQAIAQEHGITVRDMLYGGSSYRLTIPRGRFWRCLRAFTRDGKPRYSFPGIAEITGHHHTSVMYLLASNVPDLDYAAYLQRAERYERAKAVAAERKAEVAAEAPLVLPSNRRDHTGERFGSMVVLGPAVPPAGKPGRWWRCSCTCGSETVQSTKALILGKRACGANGHRAPALNAVRVLMAAE